MSDSSHSPLTRLAFSIYENSGVYALLIGSGVSRPAGIPTGWQITLDLIRRIAVAQGENEQPDWVSWYRSRYGKNPDYSELIEELGLSPEERRSILHSYIEPTAEDRENGRKLPSTAHYAIADLVEAGHIRVIVTTNFDHLLEDALRERGVGPTVVSSVDALKGAEPLTHTKCYLLKLHGDYKDFRILNTEHELSKYPPEIDAILDRIFDEHGLVVCGWSGEWDHALRAAILRNPSRRYSMFWTTVGKPNNRAVELINHRAGNFVPITDADSFFANVRDQVETLASTHRKSPQTTDLLVSSTKRYLAEDKYRIRLDDLFESEVRSLLRKLEAPEFSMHDQWSGEEFRRRIAIYDAAVEPLAQMVGVLGRWGTGSQITMLIDIIRSIHDRYSQGSGSVPWTHLRSYPAVVLVTAYGVGLVRSRSWHTLHEFLSSSVEARDRVGLRRVVEELFSSAWDGAENHWWRSLEGFHRRKTALSDHLHQMFLEWGKGFLGLVRDFEILYETWEIIASLTYCERFRLEDLNENRGLWIPIGRSGWNIEVRKTVFERIKSDDLCQTLLEAGFGKGNREFLDRTLSCYGRAAWRMPL